MNLDGKLFSLVYGKPCSVHVDPIEKKPLFHVLPQSRILSLATAGCNLHCKYCQNWQISQRTPEETHNYDLPPNDVIRVTLKEQCQSIAYTYSEPIIFYEYMYDTSVLAKERGLLNVMVTAGYIEQKPLLELCPVIDAANVDLKGITEEYYRNMCSGTLRPVLETLKTMKKKGVWVEITNLIVPTFNDKKEDIKNLCQWVFDNMGPDTPIHLSRFSPLHQLQNLPPTPASTLDTAWEIAQHVGLHFPYVGNIPGHQGNNTYCPSCKELIIRRRGYAVLENNLIDEKCKFCQNNIPGIWRI